MKRSERIELLGQLFKESILEHARHDIGWYLNRMEQLTSQDLSDPAVQSELRNITSIVVNRYEEEKEEKEEKKQRQIGFRMSYLIEQLRKCAIEVQDPRALERKIRFYSEKAINDLVNDPEITPLIEKLPADVQSAIQDGFYSLEQIMHALFEVLEEMVESAGGDFTYTTEKPRGNLS